MAPIDLDSLEFDVNKLLDMKSLPASIVQDKLAQLSNAVANIPDDSPERILEWHRRLKILKQRAQDEYAAPVSATKEPIQQNIPAPTPSVSKPIATTTVDEIVDDAKYDWSTCTELPKSQQQSSFSYSSGGDFSANAPAKEEAFKHNNPAPAVSSNNWSTNAEQPTRQHEPNFSSFNSPSDFSKAKEAVSKYISASTPIVDETDDGAYDWSTCTELPKSAQSSVTTGGNHKDRNAAQVAYGDGVVRSDSLEAMHSLMQIEEVPTTVKQQEPIMPANVYIPGNYEEQRYDAFVPPGDHPRDAPEFRQQEKQYGYGNNDQGFGSNNDQAYGNNDQGFGSNNNQNDGNQQQEKHDDPVKQAIRDNIYSMLEAAFKKHTAITEDSDLRGLKYLYQLAYKARRVIDVLPREYHNSILTDCFTWAFEKLPADLQSQCDPEETKSFNSMVQFLAQKVSRLYFSIQI